MQTYDMVQAGYGEADITPDSPAEMVGFYRPDNRSQGVRDSLRLQALVWESDGVRGGLIAIDSLGFTVDLSNVFRDRAAAALHTGRERIMVCFSHTHSAPNAAEEPDYFEMVCRKADRAVREAAGNMKPMEAAWGIGENTVGINRRNEPDQMDGRLGILKLAARDGKGKEVLLIRVTAHANVLSGDNYFISADYIGAARKRLEETYNCRVMMVQGAAGDIRPKYHQDNLEYLEVHCCEMARNGFSQEYRKKIWAPEPQGPGTDGGAYFPVRGCCVWFIGDDAFGASGNPFLLLPCCGGCAGHGKGRENCRGGAERSRN